MIVLLDVVPAVEVAEVDAAVDETEVLVAAVVVTDVVVVVTDVVVGCAVVVVCSTTTATSCSRSVATTILTPR